ncbi:MAG: bifunctional demethylmenaquinone methyltransferase/2-methoxy-6-polyprenyl-1,4-benzoquinol methylase UbiE [Candidatus Sumerlaeia bacterium]|nr:bifunctional demethylmenaquinone methyltransferase/2-methoxy-6-polyprenyl-1,4-benzoquinol methylase UbiE [Candidatus Sumerlaeia bacterium]
MTTASPPQPDQAPSRDARRIRAMFAEIAPRYDLLNHLLSLNIDRLWRRETARRVLRGLRPQAILDVACGTGDLAVELSRQAPRARVYGADFTRPMLELATGKDRPRPAGPVRYVEADGMRLPFPDGSFDVLTVAFGLRNMEDYDAALREFHRVLRPGGRLAVLEFTQPESELVRTVYLPYFLNILPRVAGMLSQRSAYTYLPKSVLSFPTRRELAAKMGAAGFQRVRHGLLHMRIAALHLGERD